MFSCCMNSRDHYVKFRKSIIGPLNFRCYRGRGIMSQVIPMLTASEQIVEHEDDTLFDAVIDTIADRLRGFLR